MLQTISNNGTCCLVELKKGTGDVPAFFFSGGNGNPAGLLPLTSRMHNAMPLIGIDFCRYDAGGKLPATVEVMAALSCSAIRSMQPHGPYHLIGYSFGGLVATEVAHLLQNSGEQIALLGLIDTLFDQRYWPTSIFFRSQVRLIRHHLALLSQLPPRTMVQTLVVRVRGFIHRLVSRRGATIKNPHISSTDSIEQRCKDAMGIFGPKRYSGQLTCFDAEDHDDYGCHPAELWRSLATDVERVLIRGTHVGILQNDESLNELAQALDSTFDRIAAQRSSIAYEDLPIWRRL